MRYVKRIRMEIDLRSIPPLGPLPEGYFWTPWNPALIADHAEVKRRAFDSELDALLFPCLGSAAGCLDLMREIANRRTFVPEATWLIGRGMEYVATVQGTTEPLSLGMIQNLGVVPEERGRGLGSLLMIKALLGFRRSGHRRAMLEVTAENLPAVRIYRRIGFRRTKVHYRTIETAA